MNRDEERELPTDNRKWRSPAFAFLLFFALSAGTGFAVAAEGPTRPEYVQELEAICKPDALATQRAMKGARGDVQAERLQVAAPKFAKAAKIFGGTVKEIAAVPRPAADRERLKKRFSSLHQQEG